MSTREIARAAVREQLSQTALDLFWRDGFEQVTINDLAAAAGVSRSTFLRYFETKEDAALGALDAQEARVAEALLERPAAEDDWTALCRAFDPVVEKYLENSRRTVAVTRLVQETPALCARRLGQEYGRRPALAEALAERAAITERPVPLAIAVRAAAALDCLNVAVEHWATTDGKADLHQLVNDAFAALAAVGNQD